MSCSTSMLEVTVEETVNAGNSSLQYDPARTSTSTCGRRTSRGRTRTRAGSCLWPRAQGSRAPWGSGSPFTLVGSGSTQAVTVRFTPTASATGSTNVNFTADGDTISWLATGTGTGGIDTTPPAITITSPTSSPTFATSSSPLTLVGTASDNVGVTQVTWANSRGGSGTATGTTSWTAGGIVLQVGSNVLT